MTMITEIEASVTDFKLVTKIQNCTIAEKNEILMILYERYKNLILKICFHYLKDYDQAQDVFHDAFIKVVENADKLKNPEVFRSWFVTITRNLCIDRIRRMSLRDQESITNQTITRFKIEDLYVAEIEKDRLLVHLSDCIQKLDESFLTILKLRWQGFKMAEISRIIGINRTELRQSYRKIKTVLESGMVDKGIKISMDNIIKLGMLTS
jgi:RNA polymerase sigma-70 factor (ECF subfamily)